MRCGLIRSMIPGVWQSVCPSVTRVSCVHTLLDGSMFCLGWRSAGPQEHCIRRVSRFPPRIRCGLSSVNVTAFRVGPLRRLLFTLEASERKEMRSNEFCFKFAFHNSTNYLINGRRMEAQMHTNVHKHCIAMLWTVDISVMNIIDTFVKCCSDLRSSSESDDSYRSNYWFRNNIHGGPKTAHFHLLDVKLI